MQCVLSYLAILKSGLGLAFGAHFLQIFFPGLTLSIEKVFKFQTKCFMKFLFRQFMMS